MSREIIIAALSDTHGRHGALAVPEGDLLIHAGDGTRHGTLAELEELNRWAGALPHARKILIAGNHDECLAYEPERARRAITHAVYLEDSGTTVADLRVWGSPWQPEFNNWHFNLPRGEKLKAKWDLIPDGTDILVTHGPPAGIRDEVFGGERVGCEELRAAIRRVKPLLHVFGHVHEGYGWERQEGTLFVNACSLDRLYRVRNPPVRLRLDLDARTVEVLDR